jgi:hypothetical protein
MIINLLYTNLEKLLECVMISKINMTSVTGRCFYAMIIPISNLLVRRPSMRSIARKAGSVLRQLESQAPSSLADWVAVIVLFAIAFSTRARITGYGLPYQGVWDEAVTYPQALQMLTVPGLKPAAIDVPGYGTASYGDLLVYLTAGGDVLGLLDAFRTNQVDSIQEFVSPPQGVASIFQAVHPSGIPLLYPRLLLALVNSLAPVGVYLILRRVFGLNRWFCFGGALIYAVFSREGIYYSAYILPDSLATTLTVFLFWASYEAHRRQENQPWLWVVSGVLAGLVVNTTFRLVTVLAVPILAALTARGWKSLLPRLGWVLLGALAGFVLTSPYSVLDLPNALVKLTGFAWDHDLSWAHRLSSLGYYLQGIFLPGFDSMYIGIKVGSVGLGLVAGMLAILGMWKWVRLYPRQALVALLFFGLHFYSILPVTQRYTRHALVVYPLVCMAAGIGLQQLTEFLSRIFQRLQERFPHLSSQSPSSATILVFSLFLLASAPQIALSLSYVSIVEHASPSQVQTAEYLQQLLQPGEKVGIVDVIPWVEADLIARGIPFERISLQAAPEELRAGGITYVVGSDAILPGCGYGDIAGTFWETAFQAPGSKLAEFGYAYLQCLGYPNSDAYLLVGRVP